MTANTFGQTLSGWNIRITARAAALVAIFNSFWGAVVPGGDNLAFLYNYGSYVAAAAVTAAGGYGCDGQRILITGGCVVIGDFEASLLVDD